MERWRVGEGGGASPVALPLQHNISLRGVSYRYPAAAGAALADVTLDIPKGSTTAIVGASGAGKTTLVDIILGLLPPDAGAVLVDGTDIAGDTRAWQRSVACVPQGVYLTDDSVRRNVAFGVSDADIDDTRVWEALEQAQVADVVHRESTIAKCERRFTLERGRLADGGTVARPS